MNKARIAKVEAAVASSFEGRLHAAKLDGDYSRLTPAELDTIIGGLDFSTLSDALIADILNRSILRAGVRIAPPGAPGEVTRPEAFTPEELARGKELAALASPAYGVGDLSDSDLRALVGYCMTAAEAAE